MAVPLDARGIAHARQRDQHLGRELPPFHVRKEIGAPRDEHHAEGRRAMASIELAGAVLGEQLRCLAVGTRLDETEPR
jgi:hypothetical protein